MAVHRGLVFLTWMLAFMCCQPVTAASRLPTAHKLLRGLQGFHSTKPQVIRAELIHRNHPEWPIRELTGAGGHDAAPAASRHRAGITGRRLAAGVEFQTPVGSAFAYQEAEYVMTLYLGTPLQRFVVIVDTGSDLVWVQCLPCRRPYRCFNETDPYFDPSASSSYSPVPCDSLSCDQHQLAGAARCNALRNCHISYAYGTPGSGIAGVLSTETISFSNSTTDGLLGISNVLFGCMDNDTSSFGTVDGLVGLGRGPFSLPSQLSRLTSSDVFSYCLVPFLLSSSLTSPLLFGASNTSQGLQLVYTAIVNNPDVFTYYWVNMTGISVNGTAVSIPKAPLEWNSSSFSGGTIFDSGTTETIFSDDIWAPVAQSLMDLITYPTIFVDNTSLCYNVSGVQQPEFPSVSFQFSGVDGGVVDFPLYAQNLFFPNSTDDLSVLCLAIIPAGTPFLGPNIIGNIAQGDHYIESDLGNMRIGWTSRDCSLPL